MRAFTISVSDGQIYSLTGILGRDTSKNDPLALREPKSLNGKRRVALTARVNPSLHWRVRFSLKNSGRCPRKDPITVESAGYPLVVLIMSWTWLEELNGSFECASINGDNGWNFAAFTRDCQKSSRMAVFIVAHDATIDWPRIFCENWVNLDVIPSSINLYISFCEFSLKLPR